MRTVWNIGPMGDFGSNQTNNAGNSEAATCNCSGNPPATSRTVRKEGPNKGSGLFSAIFLGLIFVFRSPVFQL
jgi:hypothetical protein